MGRRWHVLLVVGGHVPTDVHLHLLALAQVAVDVEGIGDLLRFVCLLLAGVAVGDLPCGVPVARPLCLPATALCPGPHALHGELLVIGNSAAHTPHGALGDGLGWPGSKTVEVLRAGVGRVTKNGQRL